MINWCVTSSNTSWVKHPGSTSTKGKSRELFEVLLNKEFWFAQGNLSAVSVTETFNDSKSTKLSLIFLGFMDSSRSTTSKTQEVARKFYYKRFVGLKFLCPITKTEREARFYCWRKSKDLMKKMMTYDFVSTAFVSDIDLLAVFVFHVVKKKWWFISSQHFLSSTCYFSSLYHLKTAVIDWN